MPILTNSRRSQENEPQAKALLEEGDGHLAEGNNDKALDCYIRAADISYSITAEYAHKAAKIALQSPAALSPVSATASEHPTNPDDPESCVSLAILR